MGEKEKEWTLSSASSQKIDKFIYLWGNIKKIMDSDQNPRS